MWVNFGQFGLLHEQKIVNFMADQQYANFFPMQTLRHRNSEKRPDTEKRISDP